MRQKIVNLLLNRVDYENEFELADAILSIITESEDDIDLNLALSFCYAILGAETAENAARVWEMNPEERLLAHRAIYERKPREEPYDDMMARLRPNLILPTPRKNS